MDLILSDTLNSVAPKSIFIFSHVGGTLPTLVYRPAGMLPYTPFSVAKSTEQIVEEASKFYYDIAISSNPLMVGLLFQLAKPGHVLLGTDFPNAPTESIKSFIQNFEKFGLSDEQRREAAEKLLSKEGSSMNQLIKPSSELYVEPIQVDHLH